MPKPTLRTRKPAGDLDPVDLSTFPVWKYVMDEAEYDETYVKPLPGRTIPAGDLLHVAATFTSANGTELAGCIEVVTLDESPEYRFPMVFSTGGFTDLTPPGGPLQCEPGLRDKIPALFEKNYREHLANVESAFGASAERVFPIKWEASASFDGTERKPNGLLGYPPASGYEIVIVEQPQWLQDVIKKGAGDA